MMRRLMDAIDDRPDTPSRVAFAAELIVRESTGAAPRVASVRVILDTPDHELSDAWLNPWTVLVRPDAWGQVIWVAREAPRCARLAATVLARALSLDGD